MHTYTSEIYRYSFQHHFPSPLQTRYRVRFTCKCGSTHCIADAGKSSRCFLFIRDFRPLSIYYLEECSYLTYRWQIICIAFIITGIIKYDFIHIFFLVQGADRSKQRGVSADCSRTLAEPKATLVLE